MATYKITSMGNCGAPSTIYDSLEDAARDVITLADQGGAPVLGRPYDADGVICRVVYRSAADREADAGYHGLGTVAEIR